MGYLLLRSTALNSNLLNAALLGSHGSNPLVLDNSEYDSDDDIVFNGYGLQNEYIITSQKNDDNFPNIDLTSFRFPRNDGGGVLGKYYTGRDITLRGIIKANPGMTLDETIDDFKLNVGVTEGYLDIKRQDGLYRRIKATVVNDNIIKRDHYHISFAPYELQLRSVEPYWYEFDDTVVSILGQSSDISYTVEYTGTANANPLIYLIMQTATGVTSITLTIGGNSIVITGTFAAGDIIVFDIENFLVYKNGSVIDRNGVMPYLSNGSNEIILDLNGTFSVDATVYYKNNFK